MSEAVEYHFVCPECAQTIEVNASMREALMENGCVVCGAPVSDDAFAPATGGSSASNGEST